MHAIAQGGVRNKIRDLHWEKKPLPHRGIEPASAACRSDAGPTELHPHTVVTLLYSQLIVLSLTIELIVFGHLYVEIFVTIIVGPFEWVISSFQPMQGIMTSKAKLVIIGDVLYQISGCETEEQRILLPLRMFLIDYVSRFIPHNYPENQMLQCDLQLDSLRKSVYCLLARPQRACRKMPSLWLYTHNGAIDLRRKESLPKAWYSSVTELSVPFAFSSTMMRSKRVRNYMEDRSNDNTVNIINTGTHFKTT